MVSDDGGNGLFLPRMPLKAEPETKACTRVIYLGGNPKDQE